MIIIQPSFIFIAVYIGYISANMASYSFKKNSYANS